MRISVSVQLFWLLTFTFCTVLADNIFDLSPEAAATGVDLEALATIEGVNSHGTGFIVKWNDQFFLLTNIHVLDLSRFAADYNPQRAQNYLDKGITARTLSGKTIRITNFFTANDRDIALIPLTEEFEHYLSVAENISVNSLIGRPVFALGNSRGRGTIIRTEGSVVALGPNLVETDTPVYGGNSGGPLIEVETNLVIGVITFGAVTAPETDFFSRAAFEHRNASIRDEVRYFSHRLDNIESWEHITLAEFHRQRILLERAWFKHFMVINAHDAPLGDPNRIYQRDAILETAVREYRAHLSSRSRQDHSSIYSTFINRLKVYISPVMREFNSANFHWWFKQNRLDYEGLMNFNRFIEREFERRR